MVTPAGVLGAHVNAGKFCEHIPQHEYPQEHLQLHSIVSGVRGMERVRLLA